MRTMEIMAKVNQKNSIIKKRRKNSCLLKIALATSENDKHWYEKID
jgi:hypothetical protein